MSVECRAALRGRIDAIVAYLTPLLPLASCHTVEFYTARLWSTLVPRAVRGYVEEKDVGDVVQEFWRAAEGGDERTPLSHFVRQAMQHHTTCDGVICLSHEDARRRLQSAQRGDDDVDTRTFMSAKKGHEVERLVWVASRLGGSHGVELGAGKGYLGEALARTGLPALSVDCDQVALSGGVRRARTIKKVLPRSREGRHRFANQFVTESTDLVSLVEEYFPEDFQRDECRLLIAGLHTCGDLGPSSLRLFARQQAAHALLNVPCCYHLLSEPVCAQPLTEETCDRTAGFPMSDYLRGFQLGRNARMLASQSLDKTVAERTVPSVGLHYRAVLQVLIRKYLPDSGIPEGKLKGIAAKSKDFREYFTRAIDKLKLSDELSDVLTLTDVEDEYNCQRKSLVMSYLLRLCLAQVVESLILLDRLMFLYEMGFEDSVIVKLLDPVQSPRCHAILVRR